MGSSLGTENGGPAMHVAGELASAPHLPPRLPPPPCTPHTFPGAQGMGGSGEKADGRAQGTSGTLLRPSRVSNWGLERLPAPWAVRIQEPG